MSESESRVSREAMRGPLGNPDTRPAGTQLFSSARQPAQHQHQCNVMEKSCLLPPPPLAAGRPTVSIGSIITTKPPLSPANITFRITCPHPCVWIRSVSIKTGTHNREYDRTVECLFCNFQHRTFRSTTDLVLRALLRT